MNIRIIYIGLMMALGSGLYAQSAEPEREFNPMVPDFLADPSVVMINDTFYLYATTDIDRGLEQMGPPVVWKSADFVDWQFEGTLIPQIDWQKPYPYVDVKGQNRTGYFRYWAPGKLIEKDGRYFLFPTIVTPNEIMGTYTMVADHPEGPFSFINGETFVFGDSLSSVIQARPLVPDIDGEPFIDFDGDAYMVWRRRFAARMNAGFDSLVGEPLVIPTNFTGYSEGPVLFRRDSIYYYIYTLAGHSNYCNAYMMGYETALGPWTVPPGKSVFIHSSVANKVWGPGHGNVFRLPGTDRHFFLYLEYGEGGTTRQIFADPITFAPDGSIEQLIPDRKGVGYLAPASETRTNLAAKAKVTASSEKPPREVKARIISDPNALPKPQVNSRDGEWFSREFNYLAGCAADGSNGTRWMAADEDKAPWIMLDLGEVKPVEECRFYFVFPTLGHQWTLETSTDSQVWQQAARQNTISVRSPHVARQVGQIRFLRLSIQKGAPGLWEIKVF